MKRTLMGAALLLLASCAGDCKDKMNTVEFQCGGETVTARYVSADMAILTRGGRAYRMKVVESASGARYTGEGWQWWAKGREATLTPLTPGQELSGNAGLNCTAR